MPSTDEIVEASQEGRACARLPIHLQSARIAEAKKEYGEGTREWNEFCSAHSIETGKWRARLEDVHANI